MPCQIVSSVPCHHPVSLGEHSVKTGLSLRFLCRLLTLFTLIGIEGFSGIAAADESRAGTSQKPVSAASVSPGAVMEFSGRILKPDGSNAAGAQIIAVRIKPVSLLEDRIMAMADENGEVSLKLPGVRDSTARWDIFAVSDDDGGRLETSFEVPDGSSDSVSNRSVIQLKPGRKVVGTIIDRVTQTPVPGAKVFTIDGRVSSTDEQGHFLFRGLREDIAEFVVSSPGRQTVKFVVDATERHLSEVNHIEVSMPPGGVACGRVVDKDGNPVVGATVYSSIRRSVFSAAVAAPTDDHGQFRLDGVALNRMIFPLAVSASGYDRGDGQMFVVGRTARTAEVTLTVTKQEVHDSSYSNSIGGSSQPDRGVIAGKVTMNGVPVRNFRVQLLSFQSPRNDAGSFAASERLQTSPEGRFQIGQLNEGRSYRVLVAADDGSYAIVEPLFAHADLDAAKANEAEFVLKKPQRLVVKLVDEESGRPIANVLVGAKLNEPRPRLFAWTYRLTGALVEWTSNEGLAVFESLAAESGTVFVQLDGYERKAVSWSPVPSPVPGSEDSSPLVVSLRKEARMRLRVRGDAKQKYGRILAQISDSENDYMAIEGIRVNSEDFESAMSMLPPGTFKISLIDVDSKTALTPIATRRIELHSGDNDVQIDLSEATNSPR